MGREIISLQYMEDFHCIGPKCEDSCCIGWRVSIDESTYKRYRKVKHSLLEPLLDKNVTRNRSNPTAANYAKIKMEKDGRCPFLTKDMWCNIQKHLGEEYLSDTCNYYPRTTNSVNGVLEMSCTVSCPEVTRKVLLKPDSLKFTQSKEQIYSGPVTKTLDTDEKFASNPMQKYFWQLRLFIMQILQYREIALWERLIILGLFMQKLQNLLNEAKAHDIPHTIAIWSSEISSGNLDDSIASVPEQTGIQMKMVKQIADKRFIQGINNQRYLECYKDMLIGLGYVRGATDEQIEEQYRRAYTEYYLPYMDEREYMLENYLVNYVFKNMFPLTPKAKDVFEQYVMLVIHYAMIKMHLIGLAGEHEGLSEDIVIKLVQSFAKTVEHNTAFIRQVLDLLKEYELTSMGYMAILIKN